MVEDVRRVLAEGRGSVPAVGAVVKGETPDLPFVVVDGAGEPLEPVSAYLRDLMLGDASPLTCRSYGFDLLRWHRLLWCLGVAWDKATEAEVATLVGWLRVARNPQRQRSRPGSPPAGSVNLKTGKPALRAGYAPTTINHALTVIHGFYAFHGRFGAGPVANPVSAQRRQVLAHRSPLEPVPLVRRARLRQRVPAQAPRAIPDGLWAELFAQMGCDRDRALLESYVSSGALGQPGALRRPVQRLAEVGVGVGRFHLPQGPAEPGPHLLEVSHVGGDRGIGQPGRRPRQHEPGSRSVSNAASSSGPAGARASRMSRTTARPNPRPPPSP